MEWSHEASVIWVQFKLYVSINCTITDGHIAWTKPADYPNSCKRHVKILLLVLLVMGVEVIPWDGNPSWEQAAPASSIWVLFSQTVPQWPSTHTSTLPSPEFVDEVNSRISSSKHPNRVTNFETLIRHECRVHSFMVRLFSCTDLADRSHTHVHYNYCRYYLVCFHILESCFLYHYKE